MSATAVEPGKKTSTIQPWVRALQFAASIPHNRERTMPTVVEELARRQGSAPALLSDGQCLTYDGLASKQNQYARWALAQGMQKGDVVCLLMHNCPEYFAVWLGLTSVGVVTALLNTNLSGDGLLYCIQSVRPKHIIVARELAGKICPIGSKWEGNPAIWVYGESDEPYRRIDLDVAGRSGRSLSGAERRKVTIEDRALCIYTSGTTGLPKAANLCHARALQWSYWFAGMLGIEPHDRMYNCLPMYHGVGGVMVPGAVIAGGGSVVIRDKFSASHFWADVAQWKCSIFQYIGELCRYLLHTTSPLDAPAHELRMICGNGMAPEVWREFKNKFSIPRIVEFYASTEGGVSLFNVEEECGSIGRVPPYLRHRFSPELVRCDVDTYELVRDSSGRCVRCAPNEIGEAIGKVNDAPTAIGTRFEGYTDEEASQKKLIRDVFEPGDVWVRTGDLMRKDSRGFFYFVDRIGDSYRWKGENVAASEVSAVLCAHTGIQHAIVFGTQIPGMDGRAGMAAVVSEGALEWVTLREHLSSNLPSYARPIFIRLCKEMHVNGTFKYAKGDLMRQGYDPTMSTDPIYFDHPERKEFVRLDQQLLGQIQSGKIRI